MKMWYFLTRIPRCTVSIWRGWRVYNDPSPPPPTMNRSKARSKLRTPSNHLTLAIGRIPQKVFSFGCFRQFPTTYNFLHWRYIIPCIFPMLSFFPFLPAEKNWYHTTTTSFHFDSSKYFNTRPWRVDFAVGHVDFQITCLQEQAEILEIVNIYLQLYQVYIHLGELNLMSLVLVVKLAL